MLRKKLSLFALPLVAAVSLQAQTPFNDSFNDPFFQDPFGDDIFKEMIQMQRQMDEMFRRMQQRINQRSARLVHPTMGMYRLSAQSEFADKGDHYEMVTNIPESKENHIDIRTENGMLTISAKIVHEEQQKTNGMVSTSRSIQSYQQSTSLPSDADGGNIKSEFRNGRLVIIIGKKAKNNAVQTTTAPATQPKISKVTSQTTAQKPQAQSLPKVDASLKKVQSAAVEKVDVKAIENQTK